MHISVMIERSGYKRCSQDSAYKLNTWRRNRLKFNRDLIAEVQCRSLYRYDAAGLEQRLLSLV